MKSMQHCLDVNGYGNLFPLKDYHITLIGFLSSNSNDLHDELELNISSLPLLKKKIL